LSGWLLLVEDDEDDVFFFTRALAEEKVPGRLSVCKDGGAAAELLARLAAGPPEDLPDLIVLDLKLPKMNGLELLKRIRTAERLKELRVAILTASADAGDRAEAESLGVSLYLRKPSDTQALRDVMRRIGGLLGL
jgi:two-component system response regulator